jgi:hypothetical protein
MPARRFCRAGLGQPPNTPQIGDFVEATYRDNLVVFPRLSQSSYLKLSSASKAATFGVNASRNSLGKPDKAFAGGTNKDLRAFRLQAKIV